MSSTDLFGENNCFTTERNLNGRMYESITNK